MPRLSVALAAVAVVFGHTAVFAADHEILEQSKKFEPNKITIKAGDSLTFVNNDGYVHNVHSKSEGNEFDSGSQEPGSTFTVNLANPGKVKIRCAIHPKMKMTVVVE